MEKVRPWCGQPSDRGRLRNRTGPVLVPKTRTRVEQHGVYCVNLGGEDLSRYLRTKLN